MAHTNRDRSSHGGPAFNRFRSLFIDAWRWLNQTPGTLSNAAQRQARLVADATLYQAKRAGRDQVLAAVSAI